jgi:hypothetical protein
MAEHTDHKIYKTKELPGVALTLRRRRLTALSSQGIYGDA